MSEVKIYGGFANLEKQTFNIYAYDVEDNNTGEFIFKVPVPTSEITSNVCINASQLNKELKIHEPSEFAPWYSFVFYSKSKDLVEDTLKDYKNKITQYYKEKLEMIEPISINDKGNGDDVF